MTTIKTIEQISTPALLIDIKKMRQNIRRMANHISSLNCILRPHVKTHKSIHVTKEIINAGSTAGITVSTLKEAEYFFDNGVTDIFYAVGISTNKLVQAASLIKRGCDLKITLDNINIAKLVSKDGEDRNLTYKVLIELDCDGHRSGADPLGQEVIDIGHMLHNGKGTELLGVMTHAGESYNCRTPDELLSIARQERDRTITASTRLKSVGLPCPVVSIGSTPTALSIDYLGGVTEVRAGVYVLFDLVMAGIGVCNKNQIAISILSTVIGHQDQRSWMITDAGWMAMSRDRGTSNQGLDYGYGVVCDIDGNPIGDLIVEGVNQEHGIISSPTGHLEFANFPLGSLLSILPNHACSTASQFDKFFVTEDGNIIAEWPRIRGW